MKAVPFFNYPALFSEHKEKYLDTFSNVLSRGAYIMQSELEEFEEKLAKYLGCRHTIGVADGTAALEMSLIVSGVRPGDEVIVSSHTFVATAAAVHSIGGIPVIADCQADSMIDCDSVVKMISSKTKAIMPTQLNGRTCDMHQLRKIASDHNLIIVEDSCQAMGATYDNTPAGLFGIAGSYSFYPAKTLGCFGDGGAISTNSDEAAEHIRLLRDHGRGPDGKVRAFGRNGRLDNIQAAILSVKLDHYDDALSRRREIADMYQDALSNIDGLILPPPPNSDALRFDIFQNYEIQSEHRDELREYLSQQGIGTILQWGGWMLHQFDDLGLRADAPYASKMVKRYMMLPMHHMLSNEDVEYVCDKVAEFHRKTPVMGA